MQFAATRASAAARRASSSAPTPLAAQMWPRSASSPSETSTQALASPRSGTPAATRGCGRVSRSIRVCAQRWRDARRRAADRCSAYRPGGASPSVPVTSTASPTRAPPRTSAWPGGTKPCTATLMRQRPAGGIAANQGQPMRLRQLARSLRQNPRRSPHPRAARSAPAAPTPAWRPSRRDRRDSPPALSSRCRCRGAAAENARPRPGCRSPPPAPARPAAPAPHRRRRCRCARRRAAARCAADQFDQAKFHGCIAWLRDMGSGR